ncbi:MAG: hypothetical protein QXY45_00045 [Candidatus Aenigmatarchaeota archaeon]
MIYRFQSFTGGFLLSPEYVIEQLKRRFPNGFTSREGMSAVRTIMGGNYFVLRGEDEESLSRAPRDVKERTLEIMCNLGYLERREMVGGTPKRPIYTYQYK